ncbi:oligosaccharide flippase family protein [Comamonas jiangduensis]|uniref:oligosaccharide flippase family protein n=1 Tax=Comamonas jiangduensis TaxID=1194168 RepID=UPI003BF79EE6
MTDNRRAFLNALFLLTVQGVNFLSPLVLMGMLVSRNGIGIFGEYSFSYAISIYVQGLIDYGFMYTGVLQVSNSAHSGRKIARIFFSILFAKLFIASIVLIAAFVVFFFIESRDFYIVIGILIGVANALMPNWYFQGRQKTLLISCVNVASKLIFLTSVFLFVDFNASSSEILRIQFLSIIPACILANYLVFSELEKIGSKFNYSYSRLQIINGWNMFSTSISSLLVANGATFWIGIVAGSYAVGVYSAVEKIYKGISGLALPLMQAIFPLNCRNFKAYEFYKAIKLVVIQSVFVYAFIFLVVAAIYILSDRIFLILKFNREMIDIYWIYSIPLTLWVLLSVCNNFLGLQILSASGNQKFYAYGVNLFSLIYFATLFLLVRNESAVNIVPWINFFAELILSLVLVYGVFYKVWKSEKNNLSAVQ